MEPSASPQPPTVSANLLSYLGVLARRRWVILPMLVITPVVALALELQKPARYEATADLFVNRPNLAASLAGIAEPASPSDVERAGNTLARLARVPEIARRAVTSADVPQRSAHDLLGASSVVSDPDADVLHFTVRDGDPEVARRLATAYAEQFVAYRAEVAVAANDRALKGVEQQLERLRAEGAATSSLHAELVAKKHQLETLNALQTSDAWLVLPAGSAAQISPRPPMRAAALGLGFGIVLAIALAFLADALDTRIKTVDELESTLEGLPILGRLPDPPTGAAGNVAMLTDPGGRYSEAVRMLRVRLALASTEPGPQLIMVTSATAREGKSTTVANLAVAFARAGQRVVLCDLDTRRPMIHSLFKLPPQPGLTDVVQGDVSLEDALTVVPISARTDTRRNGRRPGALEVLTVGYLPTDPGELVGSAGVVDILERLRSRADVLLVDTPAILSVGDAMTIAGFADAVIGVVRLGLVKRAKVRELARAFTTSPATPLGFVATGSVIGDRYDLDLYYQDPGLPAERPESIQR